MKALIKSLAVLTVSVVAALAPYSIASAASGNAVIMNLRGPLVNAGFSSTDPSGCIYTDVFVAANSGTEQEPPGTVAGALGVASVSIYKYDSCTGATLLDAGGLKDTLGAGEFQVSNQLDWAWLKTTINVSDMVSGNSFDVNVDIALTGTGDITRAHSNTNDIYPGCHVINRWKGSGRDADASGAVSDGVTNFTPATSQYAEIGFVVDGFEIIGCQ